MLVTKTAKTVNNISKLSPTHFVSNIRHKHRCSLHWSWYIESCSNSSRKRSIRRLKWKTGRSKQESMDQNRLIMGLFGATQSVQTVRYSCSSKNGPFILKSRPVVSTQNWNRAELSKSRTGAKNPEYEFRQKMSHIDESCECVRLNRSKFVCHWFLTCLWRHSNNNKIICNNLVTTCDEFVTFVKIVKN